MTSLAGSMRLPATLVAVFCMVLVFYTLSGTGSIATEAQVPLHVQAGPVGLRPVPSPPPTPVNESVDSDRCAQQSRAYRSTMDETPLVAGTVGICAVVSRRTPMLKQFLAFHQAIGAAKVIIYDLHGNDAHAAAAGPFTHSGFADYVRWPEQAMDARLVYQRGSMTYFQHERFRLLSGCAGMLRSSPAGSVPEACRAPAIIDCTARLAGQVAWVAEVHDDEYLTPLGDATPRESLTRYFARQHATIVTVSPVQLRADGPGSMAVPLATAAAALRSRAVAQLAAVRFSNGTMWQAQPSDTAVVVKRVPVMGSELALFRYVSASFSTSSGTTECACSVPDAVVGAWTSVVQSLQLDLPLPSRSQPYTGDCECRNPAQPSSPVFDACSYAACDYQDSIPIADAADMRYLPGLIAQLQQRKAPGPGTAAQVDGCLLKAASSVSPTLVDPNGDPVDFFVTILTVHCGVRLAVRELNRLHGPRYIWAISHKENCEEVLSLGHNMRCLDENDVLKGYTFQSLKAAFGSSFAAQRTGWYLNQFMNLDAARTVPELSQHYIIWDADLIPMTDAHRFFVGNRVRFQTQPSHGTVHRATGYHAMYRNLTGLPMLHPEHRATAAAPTRDDDGTQTWVAHYMVFRRDLVHLLLSRIEDHQQVARGRWVEATVRHVAASAYGDGFAETDSYGSFVKQYFGHTMHIDHSFNYIGYVADEHYRRGTCCLPEVAWTKHKNMGIHYLMWEVHKWDRDKCYHSNSFRTPSLLTYGD